MTLYMRSVVIKNEPLIRIWPLLRRSKFVALGVAPELAHIATEYVELLFLLWIFSPKSIVSPNINIYDYYNVVKNNVQCIYTFDDWFTNDLGICKNM